MLNNTRQVKLNKKNYFAIVAFNPDDETFIVYIIFFTNLDFIDSFYEAYIALLKANNAFLMILTEYNNFIDIFSLTLVAKFLKYTEINNHIIDL